MRFQSRLAAGLAVAALASVACGQDEPPKPPAAPEEPPVKAEPAKSDETWTKTASGLEYQVLAKGAEGEPARFGDMVKASYKGWLEGGKVFDESARHGGPVEFSVGGVVEGWNEALEMMTPGGKMRLRIPPHLGYGERSPTPDIPPNATMYFDLELVELKRGPDVPKFTPPDPEKQKATASGLKYEVLKEGAGEPAGPDDSVELQYVFFKSNGKPRGSSALTGPLRAPVSRINLPFLKEAAQLLREGARYRFEVPPALGFGKGGGPGVRGDETTYWELELTRLTRAQPVPKFEMPAAEKLTKTASGLQYEQVRAGEGTPPKMGETVRVHYAGWRTDGALFDSSYSRGEPAEFQLGMVIAGWNEGLQLMRPGAIHRLVIPANLAYGDHPPPGSSIRPGDTLVFLVELLDVKK